MQCKTYLSLKKCLSAVYFDIYHSMQYDMLLVTNTSTFHVQIMCKNCTVFPPTCLGGEDGRSTTEHVEGRILYCLYTGCPRMNGQNFGRVFLMLNYTDITQNTYVPS